MSGAKAGGHVRRVYPALGTGQRWLRPLTGILATLVVLPACVPIAEPATSSPVDVDLIAGVPATWPVPVLEVLDLFQSGSTFYQQSAKGSVAVDETVYMFGTSSLRLTTAGTNGQLNGRSDRIGPVDLSQRDLVLWLRIAGLENLGTVSVYVGSRDMAEYALYTAAVGGVEANELFSEDGEWYAITISLGDPIVQLGSVNMSAVASVQVSVSARSEGEVVVHLNGLATTPRSRRGAVTIMFDDARDSVYSLGLPVLEELGLSATVSAIADLAGEPGFMTVDQLRSLQDEHGWEIVAHHKTALDSDHAFDALPPEALTAELAGVRAWMLTNGLTSGIDAVSYPHGRIDADARRLVGRYFDRGRTTLRGLGLESRPPADPLRLRAYVVRDEDPLVELLDLVDRAAASGGWLILVFHQLVAVGDPAFQTFYRLDDFTAAVTKVAESGLEVVGLSH